MNFSGIFIRKLVMTSLLMAALFTREVLKAD